MVITGMLDGLDSQAVEGLVGRVRRLLDHIERHAPVSGKELAAKLFGSAHALDKEDKRTKLAGAVTRVLRERERDFNSEGYVLWEKVGILQCRVSAPVLTWSLPVPAAGGSFLDEQIRSATAGGLPLHISLFALQKYRITVPQDMRVLVVENPRLVEAAAERGMPSCVITTNGDPTTAVKTLLQQLRESGASISYHGDFDSWGIKSCSRMCEHHGAEPWMMRASDYEAAVDRAEEAGIRLDHDPYDCGETPWDPDLQAAFNRLRRQVHEEFVLDSVLGRFSEEAG